MQFGIVSAALGMDMTKCHTAFCIVVNVSARIQRKVMDSKNSEKRYGQWAYLFGD